MTRIIQIMLALVSYGTIMAQLSTSIRLNQAGFFSNGSKIAVISGSTATTFSVKSTDRQTSYYTGNLSTAATWAQSGESVKTADFSSFIQMGTFVIDVPGLGYSYPFTIGNDAFVELNRKLIRGYYYNRTSTAIDATHGGKWARNAGHPDDKVVVLPAAASTLRPAGTVLSCPKGWYDAGDYNSYIVNSGISTYTLLASYEHFSSYYDTLNLNIPESGGALPDILDEIKWNLDWMLTMQDPNDGGVYTKKTNASFDGFVMPDKAVTTRYVVQKSTAAAFDFAAVMAVAYRIYKKFDAVYANKCLDAAKSAYVWGAANPSVTFTNPAAQSGYPAVSTGGYGDNTLTDEYEWAANELYIATQNESYYAKGYKSTTTYSVPSWATVNTLGLFSLAYHRKNLTALGFADTTTVKNKIIAMANTYTTYQKSSSPYKIVMGQGANKDFVWGSNSFAANQAMILINAYLINKNIDFLNAAVSNVDYLLGRNATGYSYVTGVGAKPVMNIHHRPSGADGIVDPVPGLLSGGPSGSTGDKCSNNATYLAISFVDSTSCYTKNEIAINWNAPAVYITGATEQFRTYNGQILTNVQDNSSSETMSLLQVYPVPAATTVKLMFHAQETALADLDLYGALGERVSQLKVNVQGGQNEVELPVYSLTKGVYLVKIKTNTSAFVGKIVVE